MIEKLKLNSLHILFIRDLSIFTGLCNNSINSLKILIINYDIVFIKLHTIVASYRNSFA